MDPKSPMTTATTSSSFVPSQTGVTHNVTSPISPSDTRTTSATYSNEDDDSSNQASSDCKSPGQR